MAKCEAFSKDRSSRTFPSLSFSFLYFQTLLAAVEELESQPSLLPPRVQELTVEARARVQQFASSLIEPDVRIE